MCVLAAVLGLLAAEDAASKEQSAVPPEASKEQSGVPPEASTRRVYSKQAMQAIFTGMGLPQLTMAPAWEEGVLDAWPDTHGPFATELPELIGNLHRCQTLLEVSWPCAHAQHKLALILQAGQPASGLPATNQHTGASQ
jgi:hypothetical protein